MEGCVDGWGGIFQIEGQQEPRPKRECGGRDGGVAAKLLQSWSGGHGGVLLGGEGERGNQGPILQSL